MTRCLKRMTGRAQASVTRALIAALALLVLFPVEALAGERIVRSLKQSGIERSYIAHLPDNAGSRSSWPVIVAFHPFGTSAEEFEAATRLHAVRGSDDFVVVYPDGFRRSWNVGECCGRAVRRGIDDVGFFRAILDDLAQVVPIESKVNITGFSNGAMLVYRLMCQEPGRIAAAAPAGATLRLTDRTCAPSQSLRVLHIHGALDTWAPLAGGKSAFRFVAEQPPVASGIDFLVGRKACGSRAQTVLTSDVTCETWTRCSAGGRVSLCIVPQLGHLWPGREKVELRGQADLGPARTDIDASSAIVRFFRDPGFPG